MDKIPRNKSQIPNKFQILMTKILNGIRSKPRWSGRALDKAKARSRRARREKGKKIEYRRQEGEKIVYVFMC